MADYYSEWSGTFVRVRAEMVIAAFLLLAFVVWPVNLSHIPLLGVDLTNSSAPSGAGNASSSVPKWQILDPVLGFYLYSLLAFIFRHRVESNRSLDPAQRYDKVVSNLNEFTSELKAVDLTARIPEFVDSIGKINIQATLEGFNSQNHFNNQIDQLRTSAEGIRVPPVDQERIRNMLQRSLPSFRGNDDEKLRQQLQQAIADEFKARSTEINALVDKLQGNLSSLQTGHTRYEEMGVSLAANFSALITELRGLQERQSTELTESINAATASIDKARRELSGARDAELTERNVISFWIPVLTGGGAVSVAILMGWRAMLGM